MKNFSKIIITFLLLLMAAILAEISRKALGNKVSTGGLGPFIIYPATIAAIIAIWKYKGKDEKDNDDFQLKK
jgi:hypothetical protein